MTDGLRRGVASRATVWRGPARRVLVLDDDELIVRAVRRTLTGRGLSVEGTLDPEEALAIARRDPPHVVVSDLHMPKACGAQILAAIAEMAPTTMRVLMSADPDFRPKSGTLAAASLHALTRKADLARLGGVIVAQLRGRVETPDDAAEREALARLVANGLGRPDHEDDGHRHRVMRWTASVGIALGLPADEIARARLGAILHDVGQVALREEPFARKGALTRAESEELAEHPNSGARIVGEMPALRDALAVIVAHHERQDGTGYPARLEGNAIPRAAAVFQVADAYDAMTSGRHHAPRRTHREAVDELAGNAGKQHAADVVHALHALGAEGLAAALEG